jgi:hypothetical protein
MAYVNDLAALGLSPQVSRRIGLGVKLGMAAAGNDSQANGAALIEGHINEITTVDGSNNSVRLPKPSIGDTVVVVNDSASTLNVFPHVGGKINGGTDNAKTTQATKVNNTYQAISSAKWVKL